MAESSVIREFLVSLGFKTDEKSLKNFSAGIEGATKNVVKLVAAIEAAALTVGAGVAAFASNLESLYFASMKTGASVNNIKAFENAARNLGVTASESEQSIQGLARWMRNNPGSESVIKALGVDSRDANGNLRDTVDIMADLGTELAKKPFFLAMDWSKDLGISEDTMRAMMNGDFRRELEVQRSRLKDSGFDQASKDAHRFMEGLRELQTYLEVFAVKVEDALMNKLGVSMNELAAWFQKNGPLIADRVADVVVQFMTLAEKIGPAIMWLINKLIELDKATGGWSTKIIAAMALLNMVGGSVVVGGILSLAGAFVKLGSAIATAATAASGGAFGAIVRLAGLFGVGLALATHSDELNTGEDEELARRRAMGGPVEGKAARLASLEKKYGLPSGLLDSVWSAESGRGKNNRSHAGAKGPFQFMDDTAKQYGLANPDDFNQSSDAAARYYHDLLGKYGGNLESAVAAYNWGPGNLDRKGLGSAPLETRQYIDRVKGGMGGGGAAPQLNQTTNITVHGGDAISTGQAVAGEQDRVNARLVRNSMVLAR